MVKKAKKRPLKAKRRAPPKDQGSRKAFDQLLDDAIFGVKKKSQRG
jgi:hypothetical protein